MARVRLLLPTTLLIACASAGPTAPESREPVVVEEPAPADAAESSASQAHSAPAPPAKYQFDEWCSRQPLGDHGMQVSCRIYENGMFSLLEGQEDVRYLELTFFGGITGDGEIVESGVRDLTELPSLPAVIDLELSGDLQGIAGIEKLRALRAVRLVLPESDDMRPLLELPDLTKLSLVPFSTPDLATLKALTGLEELQLQGGGFELGVLANMSRLRILQLEGTFRDYRALHGLKALREIHFNETGPPDAERRALIKALPNAAISGP